MKWHSSAASNGSSIVLIDSILIRSNLYSVLSMIRRHHSTSFVNNTDFFDEKYKLCILHIWKNSSDWRSSCASVLVCKVKSSMHAFMVCVMLCNNAGAVDWLYALAYFIPRSTRVDRNVSCGAIMPQASHDFWSRGHCQYLEQKSKEARHLLPIELLSSASMIGMSYCSALVAAFTGSKSMLVPNLDSKSYSTRCGAACRKPLGTPLGFPSLPTGQSKHARIFSGL